MLSREVVFHEALQLPANERAVLVEALERSLEGDDFSSTEISAAWSAEIDRRLIAYDRGESVAISMETSLENIQQALAKRRVGSASS